MRGDLEWGTIPRLLADSASRHGDRPAIIDVDSNKILSFNGLHHSSRSAASAFIAHGIEPGDRIGNGQAALDHRREDLNLLRAAWVLEVVQRAAVRQRRNERGKL